MASDKQIRKMIAEIEELRRQTRNLKAKVRRRIKRMEKPLDPLERQQIEFEIESLKQNIKRLQIIEIQLSIPLIKGMFTGEKWEDGIDWSKAGRA